MKYNGTLAKKEQQDNKTEQNMNNYGGVVEQIPFDLMLDMAEQLKWIS